MKGQCILDKNFPSFFKVFSLCITEETCIFARKQKSEISLWNFSSNFSSTIPMTVTFNYLTLLTLGLRYTQSKYVD